MDIEIIQTETCVCGRAIIGIGGRCELCVQEGALAFWEYINGKISYSEYMRRLKGK